MTSPARTRPTGQAPPTATATATPALHVRDLSVRFRLHHSTVEAVTDVSFDLEPGTCLALVGESGCGKSVMVSALLGLLPANAVVRGTATLHGPQGTADLLTVGERFLARRVRGRTIGLIPQSPSSYLTPVRTVRDHLEEVLRAVSTGPDRSGADRAVDGGRWYQRAHRTAARAGLPAAALDLYPHELSGGMAQRAVTALALAGDAWLLLADEPTTGLDRALVRHTLGELRRLTDTGHAVLLVTHDLEAASQVADTVAVMYASRVIETGPTARVLRDPDHPYTQGLLNALPRNGFIPIRGVPPELGALPDGCAFAPRCGRATARCAVQPALTGAGDDVGHAAGHDTHPGGHRLACHHPC